MSVTDEMTIAERRKYLDKMQKRYRKAKRKEKGRLLDEMEAVTGQHRKGLIRLLKGSLERQPRSRERGRVYGPAEAAVVRVVAESLDWVCAERLTPNLGWLAEHLAAHGELRLTASLREKLQTVSISTVRRLLADVPRDQPRLPRKGPEQANRLAREIPAGRIAWDEAQPGHMEVDLVHHSGPSASGEYVHTLQMVDGMSGWSERAAVLGRSYRVVADGFERILARLPFPVVEMHSDNGSEFLNDHLLAFWQARKTSLSRSRAWHKNDNRFVEQKNDTLVRAYLGHDRLDTVEQTVLLNHLYEVMGLYYNLFQPVMRLTDKSVVSDPDGHFLRVKRRFGPAAAPFDRLCTTTALDPQHREQLIALRNSLNPRRLRQQIYALLDQLFRLPNAQPGCSRDVSLTLFKPAHSLKGEDTPSVALSTERTVALR